MTTRYKAVFARGGTSKALIFHLKDLPQDRSKWDALFLEAMGSPDPYGRQLDGMGGGVSSLSKVCIVGPSSRPDADVDYTFVQVQVKEARTDWQGNCGNMSSAIGPFAIDEGLVSAKDGNATVRIHNTNTRKIINATFPVSGGRSVEEGDLAIPGVSGTGAAVRLDFMEPGGASSGKLLPTGNAVDRVGDVEASLVDAANATVFIDAAAIGLTGKELPAEIEENPAILKRLAEIRAQGAEAMGLPKSTFIPFIAFVAAPQDTRTLAGETIPASEVDLLVRVISSGQPHRALPLTGTLCTAVACSIAGSIPNRLARRERSGPLRLGMPSGVLTVDADVTQKNGQWHAARGSFYRTTRRLFDGFVYA